MHSKFSSPPAGGEMGEAQRGAVLIIVLLILTLSSQYFYSGARVKRPPVPLISLPAPVMRAVDLGLHSAAASLMWVKITQDVYTWLGPGKKHQTLAADIRLVNELDPKWGYPYAFAAIMLPEFGEMKEAVEIGERGIVEAEPDWRIPYYLATSYHSLKDRANAAKYFDLSAVTPGAPESIAKVAATYGTGKNARTETKQIWQAIAESSQDPILRERARAYVEYIEYLEATGK
ncbi:hypothetical protein L0Y69_03375 [bacterium]|nr:hypothetical protein [bacterium]